MELLTDAIPAFSSLIPPAAAQTFLILGFTILLPASSLWLSEQYLKYLQIPYRPVYTACFPIPACAAACLSAHHLSITPFAFPPALSNYLLQAFVTMQHRLVLYGWSRLENTIIDALIGIGRFDTVIAMCYAFHRIYKTLSIL